MGSWCYRWEDGTVSFVSAPNRSHAVLLLDEVGAADPDRLEPVKGGFFVTYRPKPRTPGQEGRAWEEELNRSPSERALATLYDLEGKSPPRPLPRVKG